MTGKALVSLTNSRSTIVKYLDHASTIARSWQEVVWIRYCFCKIFHCHWQKREVQCKNFKVSNWHLAFCLQSYYKGLGKYWIFEHKATRSRSSFYYSTIWVPSNMLWNCLASWQSLLTFRKKIIVQEPNSKTLGIVDDFMRN